MQNNLCYQCQRDLGKQSIGKNRSIKWYKQIHLYWGWEEGRYWGNYSLIKTILWWYGRMRWIKAYCGRKRRVEGWTLQGKESIKVSGGLKQSTEGEAKADRIREERDHWKHQNLARETQRQVPEMLIPFVIFYINPYNNESPVASLTCLRILHLLIKILTADA